MTKKILVTGAGGFIGSYICQHFGNIGYEVVAAGRYVLTPQNPAFDSPNLVKFVGMTLPDPSFNALLGEFQPDILVHCAGTASVPPSLREPLEDFRRSLDINAFVLESIRREAKDCVFVYLSSAAVYGNPARLPVAETDPISPISPYGFHKWMGEMLVEEYRQLYGLSAITLRIFSAYGERLRKQIIYDLCCKFTDPGKSRVELFGTGKETRDFIHGKDVARAVEILVHTNASGVFNLASGSATTIADIADLVGEQFNHAKSIHFSGQTRQGDPLYWQANIGKISARGFKTCIDLPTGIQRTCDWFKSNTKSV